MLWDANRERIQTTASYPPHESYRSSPVGASCGTAMLRESLFSQFSAAQLCSDWDSSDTDATAGTDPKPSVIGPRLSKTSFGKLGSVLGKVLNSKPEKSKENVPISISSKAARKGGEIDHDSLESKRRQNRVSSERARSPVPASNLSSIKCEPSSVAEGLGSSSKSSTGPSRSNSPLPTIATYKPRKRLAIPVIKREPEETLTEELPDLEPGTCTCGQTTGLTPLQCQQCRLSDPSRSSQAGTRHCWKRKAESPLADIPAKMRYDRHFLDVVIDIDKDSVSSLESATNNSRPPSRADSSDTLPFVKLYSDNEELPDLEATLSRPSSVVSLESVSIYAEGEFAFLKNRRGENEVKAASVENSSSDENDSAVSTYQVGRITRCVTRNSCHTSCPNLEAAQQEFRSVCRHNASGTRALGHRSSDDRLVFARKEESIAVDVQPFPQRIVNLIKSVKDDVKVDKSFVPHIVKLIYDTSTDCFEPPLKQLSYLLRLLIESKDFLHTTLLSQVLRHILDLHPPSGEVCFTWKEMCHVVQELGLPFGIRNQGTIELYSRAYGLKYMVDALEAELLQRSLHSQRQILRSAAHEWLTCDGEFPRIRQILQWIGNALTYGEYSEVNTQFLQLDSFDKEDAKDENLPDRLDAPKILPLLQQLLQLSIAVSRSPDDACTRIACEVAQAYSRATGPFQRSLLLKTCVSPLLRYKSAIHLLQTHCIHADMPPATGALCLRDLVDSYFSCEPPNSCFTPPPTPSDGEGDEPHPQPLRRFSEDSCEELALLLWTMVEAYLAYTKARQYLPVSRRMDLSQEEVSTMRADDVSTLKEFKTHVGRLRHSLKSLCGALSRKTQLYLIQLEMLHGIGAAK